MVSPRAILGPDNPPFFLGPSAELYDHAYTRADRNFGEDSPLHASGRAATTAAAVHDSSLKEILPPFPTSGALTSYWEYELELLSWRAAVERAVGSVKLPVLTGRHVYRPQVDSVTVAASSSISGSSQSSAMAFGGRRISVDVSSSSPSAGLAGLAPPSPRTLSILLEAQESSPSESSLISGSAGSSGGSGENGGALAMGSAGSSSSNPDATAPEDPWDTLLLPPEPNPSQYSSFDDYYVALLRWTNLCQANFHSVLPPSSLSLPALLPLQRAAKSRANSSAQSALVPQAQRKHGWALHDTLLFPPGAALPLPLEYPLLGTVRFSALQEHLRSIGCIYWGPPTRTLSPGSAIRISRVTEPLSGAKAALKIQKGLDKILKRARLNFTNSGRTSRQLKSLPHAALPVVELSSPLMLLQQTPNGATEDFFRELLHRQTTQDSKERAAHRAALSDLASLVSRWPGHTTGLDSICSAIAAVLAATTRGADLEARIRLPWVGAGEAPYLLDGSPPTLLDMVSFLVDSLYSMKEDVDASRAVVTTFGSCPRHPDQTKCAATLLSSLLRQSVTFPAMILTCFRAFAKPRSPPCRASQEATLLLRTLRNLAFLLSCLSTERPDIFFCSDDIVQLVCALPGAAPLVLGLLASHYATALQTTLEAEFKRHNQVDRVESQQGICLQLASLSRSLVVDAANLFSSADTGELVARLLLHRSRHFASVGYFLFSSLVATDAALKTSPWFHRLLRRLLMSKRQHVRWLSRRLASRVIHASPSAELGSFCSRVPAGDVSEDICKASSLSLLQFWERVVVRLAADLQAADGPSSFPVPLRNSLLSALLEVICSTKLKPVFGGAGAEHEPCYRAARLLQIRTTIFSALSYVFAKGQGAGAKPKEPDTSPFRLSPQALVRLLQFVQTPHSSLPATSPAGRLHSSARASAALAVAYLFGERSVVSSLSKWWKRCPRALHKLVGDVGNSNKATTRFRSIHTIPTSPVVAFLQMLVGLLKHTAEADYTFGSTVLHCLNCLIISHPRLCASLAELPRFLQPRSAPSDIEEPLQPILFHVMEGLALSLSGSANYSSVTHFVRGLALFLSSATHERDIRVLIEYILKHHHFIKINLLLRKVQDLAPGVLLVVLRDFLAMLNNNHHAAKLFRTLDLKDTFFAL